MGKFSLLYLLRLLGFVSGMRSYRSFVLGIMRFVFKVQHVGLAKRRAQEALALTAAYTWQIARGGGGEVGPSIASGALPAGYDCEWPQSEHSLPGGSEFRPEGLSRDNLHFVRKSSVAAENRGAKLENFRPWPTDFTLRRGKLFILI